MPRRLALAAVLLCALPASAHANPSISVSASAEGVPGNLPSKVTHRLALTAGATPETVGISALGGLAVSGASVSVGEQTAVGPSLSRCPTRWDRQHDALGGLATFTVSVTIAPFATAFVDSVRRFTKPPWAEDVLDATWGLTPAQGGAFAVTSTAPTFKGAYGVELDFTMTRRSAGVYAVQGTAQSGVNSGRVELWGYAPGKTRASRVAVARVRGDEWSIPRLRPSRTGRWEFFARYRSAGKTFADDASQCGTVVRVR
jgi:hypothetical protein